jgi:asparagine synthase (glutamine-hydrolysing)
MAVMALDTLLRQAVSDQMLADVPLGAFLSGGVDSSTVVALMQAQSVQPIRTFSIGFSEADFDETQHARAVADYLGTSHTELCVTPRDALLAIPHLSKIYDEPFADSSQIPTYLVAKLAAKDVTVALSGDGGDELFGGYNRYLWGPRIWRHISRVPHHLRKLIGLLATALSPSQWDQLFSLIPGGKLPPTVGDKLYKLASIIDAKSADDVYLRLISLQCEMDSIVLGAQAASRWSDCESDAIGLQAFSEHMMFQDLVGYLPDDILTKVDRAAMAVSLETRIPLLDRRVVEFAWSLPLSLKIRSGEGKWLLRQVLYQYVPREIIERPKQGFGVPLATWLRGPLREWAEALLDTTRIEREGLLVAGPIREKWEEHLSGKRNWQHWLWNVLMFQAWYEEWTL